MYLAPRLLKSKRCVFSVWFDLILRFKGLMGIIQGLLVTFKFVAKIGIGTFQNMKQYP